MKRSETIAVCGVLIFALALRLLALSADPPSWLSWSAGIFSDEGIYSEDARLWVLYRQHMQGNFQMSTIAPLHNLMLTGIFEVFRVSLPIIRIVSLVFAMATLIAFWITIRTWYGPRTGAIALLLLSVSAPFVMYNRLGLLENPALCWLTLGYMCLARAGLSQSSVTVGKSIQGDIRLLALAGFFAALSAAWKGTFILGAIPLLLSSASLYKAKSSVVFITFAAGLAAYAAVFVIPHHADLARTSQYYLFEQYLPHTMAGVWFNIKRALFTGANDGLIPYLVTRDFVLFLAMILFALPDPKRIKTPVDRALWLWLLFPAFVFLFCSYTPSRYYMIFWPALAALAALGITQLRTQTLVRAGVGLAVFANLAVYAGSWISRTYTVRNDADILQATLPHDAWIAGQFAPELCLNNSLRSLYIQKDLANDSLQTLSVLPITHVLATNTASSQADPWADMYTMLIPGPGGLNSLPIGKKFTVRVYANRYALP